MADRQRGGLEGGYLPPRVSGRSPRRRRRRRMDIVPRSVVVGAIILVILVAAFFGLKSYADGVAAAATEERVAEVEQMLAGSTPEDYLEFNSGSQTEGTVAAEMAAENDFVSVVAAADQAVARFQPTGWWQGFTERCLVALVRSDGVEVLTRKVACVRIDPAEYES